jgi:hypothetical protein
LPGSERAIAVDEEEHMTAGAARSRHCLRQLALLVMPGRPPQHALAVADRRRPIADILDELTRRRRRAQIAARRALDL